MGRGKGEVRLSIRTRGSEGRLVKQINRVAEGGSFIRIYCTRRSLLDLLEEIQVSDWLLDRRKECELVLAMLA